MKRGTIGLRKKYQCSYCEMWFWNRNSLELHEEQHRDEKYECSTCNQTFEEEDFESHFTTSSGHSLKRKGEFSITEETLSKESEIFESQELEVLVREQMLEVLVPEESEDSPLLSEYPFIVQEDQLENMNVRGYFN